VEEGVDDLRDHSETVSARGVTICVTHVILRMPFPLPISSTLWTGEKVDTSMSSELIRAREALIACRKRASMGFFSGMGADVTGLD